MFWEIVGAILFSALVLYVIAVVIAMWAENDRYRY